jgi:hypothetical protein
MRRWKRWLLVLLIGPLAVELLYLAAVNAVLRSGTVQSHANQKPEVIHLDYSRAWSLWPGRIHIDDFSLRFQERNTEFLLTIDSSDVKVSLVDLIRQRFHATEVRAKGVSWRQNLKVDSAAGQHERLAAFAETGWARPPIRPPEPKNQPTPDYSGKGQWTIELENVEVDVREIWFCEYRFLGAGHASGAFEVQPNQHVWVQEAKLKLQPGTLTAGKHELASNFHMDAQVDIERYEIEHHQDLTVLNFISIFAGVETSLKTLAPLRFYLPELKTGGNGELAADIHINHGVLTPQTKVEVKLPLLTVGNGDADFRGNASARASVDPQTQQPTLTSAVEGKLSTKLEGNPLAAQLSGLTAVLHLTTNDLSKGPGLRNAQAELKEARVADASAVKAAVSKRVPIILPQLLGDGPMVARGAAFITPTRTTVRVDEATLGAGHLNGAAVKTGEHWSGAAASKVGKLDVGLELEKDQLGVRPLIADGWLESHLAKLGISPTRNSEADCRADPRKCPGESSTGTETPTASAR